jgi:hypothetical protein
MVTPIHPDQDDQDAGALEDQIRESYARVAYSHKVHEKCADIYHMRLRAVKLWQIGLAAVTTGGLIVTVLGEGIAATIVATITSTILLALNTYTKEHDLGELAQKHANTAGDLWSVRESYLSLLTDLVGGAIEDGIVRTRRDTLQEVLKNIYKSAPRTIQKAYVAAQEALKVKEELTFSPEEIDVLLPPQLRRNRT